MCKDCKKISVKKSDCQETLRIQGGKNFCRNYRRKLEIFVKNTSIDCRCDNKVSKNLAAREVTNTIWSDYNTSISRLQKGLKIFNVFEIVITNYQNIVETSRIVKYNSCSLQTLFRIFCESAKERLHRLQLR